MTDPKQIVRDGYDKVSWAYRRDDAPIWPGDKRVLTFIHGHCPPGGRVLDLGCGCGVPVARELAAGYRVTGVDISPVQIERAKALVPGADFICADMTEHDWSDGSFDVIVSLYALIHVPVDEQPDLLRRITGWLMPGGWLIATVGHRAWTGTEQDCFGVEGAVLYWSHADTATYRRWFEAVGLSLQEEVFIPEGDGGHTLMFAQMRQPDYSSDRLDRHAE